MSDSDIETRWNKAVEEVAAAMIQASDGHFVRNLTTEEVMYLARIAVNTAWAASEGRDSDTEKGT